MADPTDLSQLILSFSLPQEITVTENESDNFYHFHDNRVMPPHVDEALAKAEGWWFKPDFIINNLNINSAVARPWHDEVVPLGQNEPYEVKGYAYAGGGAKIIRVEISLDEGNLWRLAEIKRFEKPNAYGKHWCWVHWDISIPTFDFLSSKELLVRAWDEDMNTQPAAITWNLMGMMNNCYHRIKILPHKDPVTGALGLLFQHPAPVEVGERGNIGWREEDNLREQALQAAALSSGQAAQKPEPAAIPAGDKTFTMDEVATHNNETSAWFVHEGSVYDATKFLDEHPGGAESILIVSETMGR
jgi:nitrate reductase (NAD(P)H)